MTELLLDAQCSEGKRMVFFFNIGKGLKSSASDSVRVLAVLMVAACNVVCLPNE